MKLTVGIAVIVVAATGALVANAQADFCSSRTPEAYHSPKCDWGWVVNDPHRVERLKIPHEPSYHTYSRSVLDGRTYVFAYRDIDQKPDDMAADVYLAVGNRHKLLGSIQHLGEMMCSPQG